MKTYRVGLLGFGFIGKVHAYGHRNLSLFYDPLPFRTEITKVCTAHAETAAHAVELLGGVVQGVRIICNRIQSAASHTPARYVFHFYHRP